MYEKIEYNAMIREASFGLCEGKHKDSRAIEDQLIEDFVKTQADNVQPPRSETFEQVCLRCQEFMNYLCSCLDENDKDGNDVKHVLMISHGGYIKKFLKSVCELNDIDVINNTSISTIAIDIDIEDSVVIKCITPVSINNTSHLEHNNIMSASTE